MIASDTLFNSVDGYSGSSCPMKNIAEIKCLRVVATATNFGTRMVVNWRCVDDSD